MGYDHFIEKLEEARDFRKAGDYESAGRSYTTAAYRSFGISEFEWFSEVSSGLTSLLSASLCYRLAGNHDQGANRAEQGRLVVEDIQDTVVEGDAEIALAEEYIGDFLVVGGLRGHEDHYANALELYTELERRSSVDELIGQLSEEPFHANTVFLRRVLDGIQFEFDEDEQTAIEFRSPVERIDFKSNSYSRIIDKLLAQGVWDR